MRKILIIFMCFYLFNVATLFANNNLLCGNKVIVDNIDDENIVFCYEKGMVEIVMEDISTSDYIKNIIVAKFRLHPKLEKSFILEYSSGPSSDPGFFVSLDKAGSRISNKMESLGCGISGDGYIFTWGHTNSYFDVRRKYEYDQVSIKEVQQPFYYVGITSKNLKEIQIYAKKDTAQKVAVVSKGEEVSVILNSGTWYLIKTKNDIIGWWKPKEKSYFKAKEIEGIFYNGD